MSESEYTGPRCGAVLLPESRRKLSMRPLTSSSFPIEGMLAFTLVSRRGDQNHASIVTAWTGTLCSFAYGDFARFRMPCSRQVGLPVSETGFCSSSRVPIAPVNSPKNPREPGKTEIAEAETADDTNFRRENLCCMPMIVPPRQLPPNAAHNSATCHPSLPQTDWGTSSLSTPLSVPFSQKNAVVTRPDFQ